MNKTKVPIQPKIITKPLNTVCQPLTAFNGIITPKISSNELPLNIACSQLNINNDVHISKSLTFGEHFSNFIFKNILNYKFDCRNNTETKDNGSILIREPEDGYYFVSTEINDKYFSSYNFLIYNDKVKVISKHVNKFKIKIILKDNHLHILFKDDIKKIQKTKIVLNKISNIDILIYSGFLKPTIDYYKKIFKY